MAGEKYLSLYVNNHGKPVGIEDYITLITKLMGERGINVKVAHDLDPNAVNLIIDEFSNYLENHRIAAFKKAHPECKIVFVLTEFAESRWGVKSLNHFGGIFDSAAIALIDVYLRTIRDDFSPVTAGSLLKLLYFSPLLAYQMTRDTLSHIRGKLFGKTVPNAIEKYQERYHRTVYFHMRYLGLKACLRYADAVITSHEKIIDGFSEDIGADGKPLSHFGVLYPELNERDVLENLMVGKKLFIEITGSITPYRQQWIERTNRQLLTLGMHHVFGYCMSRPFSVDPTNPALDRGAYSLHPPQSRNWSYCSPTRIFRALSVDYSLPILTQNFHQNPIEDVCLLFEGQKSIIDLYEMYKDPERLADFIEPRIRVYNEIATVCNDRLVESLRNIMDARE